MAGCRFTSSAVNDTGSIFQRDLCASTHAFSYLESVQKTGKTRETSVNTGIFRVYTYFKFLLNKCYSLLYIETAAMFSKIQNTSFYKLCANTILNKRETLQQHIWHWFQFGVCVTLNTSDWPAFLFFFLFFYIIYILYYYIYYLFFSFMLFSLSVLA